MAHKALNTLFDDAFLRVQLLSSAQNGPTLLSFTGIGHAMGGIDIQQAEFRSLALTYAHVAFITDKTRSWGNAFDLHKVADILNQNCLSSKFDSIGNSMGGFLAIAATSVFKVNTCIAFVPQFSVKPDIVPWERRWSTYRNAISKWHIASLQNRFTSRTQYKLVSGGFPADDQHLAMMPNTNNVVKYNFPVKDHDVAARLKASRKLAPFLAECLQAPDQ